VKHIALLRAVNVGAHQMVAMADLRALLTRLGFDEPQSLLQSGNLVFGAAGPSARALELRLESAARTRLGLDTPWYVRTGAEWRSVITQNPFRREADRDPGHLHVMFLKRTPERARVAALQAAITGPELVRAGVRHLYITYPDGAGRSRLTNAVIERAIGITGTARNWNTVQKLHALVKG